MHDERDHYECDNCGILVKIENAIWFKDEGTEFVVCSKNCQRILLDADTISGIIGVSPKGTKE